MSSMGVLVYYCMGSQVNELKELFNAGKYNLLLEQSKELASIDGTYWQIVGQTYLGNYETAFDLSTKHHEEFQNSENLELKSDYFQIRGNISSYMGKFGDALKYYQDALEIRRHLGDFHRIASTLNVIAINYNIRGEIEKALQCQYQSIEINQQSPTPDRNILAASYSSISGLLMSMEKYDQAREYQLMVLEIDQEKDNPYYLSECYGTLAVIETKCGNTKQAQYYLSELQHIVEQHDNESLLAEYQYNVAIIKKLSPRIIDNADAMKTFRKLIHSDALNYSWKVHSHGHLLELLLLEFKLKQDPTILVEIKEIMTKYTAVAEDFEMYQHLTKSLILRAQLASLEGDFEEVETLLSQAVEISNEKQLIGFKKQAERARADMHQEIIRMKDLIDKHAKLVERLEDSSLDEFINKILEYRNTVRSDQTTET